MRIAVSLICFFLISNATHAQRIYGTIKNEKGELLPFASVTIKGTTNGTAANGKARYSFRASAGNFTLVCQYIGYAKLEKTITVSGDTELDFILKEQKLTMQEVVVSTDREDPAYEIIRQAIKKRTYYAGQVKNFSCDLYTKDMIKLKKLPNKVFGQKIEQQDRKDMGVDSVGKGIIYLSESVAKLYVRPPKDMKMEVLSSRVSGSSGFGFTFPVFISLYSNNVSVFSETFNPRGFVSPIADGALGYYKYKFLGTFWEDGKSINAIRVIPRRGYEPLFTGVINITDDDWRIHSFDLFLTKKSQLEILDTLQIKQLYVPVTDDVWRVKNQLLSFDFNMLGIGAGGNFLNVYSGYDVSPAFAKNFFDRVVIKYDTAVTKRTKDYWDTIRPMPLEPEENLNYKVRDSVYLAMQSDSSDWNNPDSLRKRQGKLKPLAFITSGWNRTHYGKKGRFKWGVDPLFWTTNFNTAEGVNMTLSGFLEKNIKSLKGVLGFYPEIRYGFANGHLNPSMAVEWRARGLSEKETLRRWSVTLTGGKRVSQFSKENPISEFTNTFAILFYGYNFMKTYENNFAELSYRKRFESGVFINASLLYEDRIPLNNVTNYTFRKSDTVNMTPNYPYEKIPAQFTPHQALLFNAFISFRPGQRYIQFPKTRVPIGSSMPTFSLGYTKGIRNIFGSDSDFDKWVFTVTDERNLKMAGLLKYKIGVGGFFNRKQVYIQDYKHFNGNRTWVASEYVNSYQVATYYENSTVDPFYSFGHIEHHFNGLLTNKIPFFKKLKWNLVAGSNAFYVDKGNNYFDLFIGLENIFKIFRVDWVTAVEDSRPVQSVLRLGMGGILGGSVQRDPSSGKRSRGATIIF